VPCGSGLCGFPIIPPASGKIEVWSQEGPAGNTGEGVVPMRRYTPRRKLTQHPVGSGPGPAGFRGQGLWVLGRQLLKKNFSRVVIPNVEVNMR
jgi:hypothetical protein